MPGQCAGLTKDGQGRRVLRSTRRFAARQNDGSSTRNTCSLVFQAVFLSEERESRALSWGTARTMRSTRMVRVTPYHQREERLSWDLGKLPHHCSTGRSGGRRRREDDRRSRTSLAVRADGPPEAQDCFDQRPVPTTDSADDQPPPPPGRQLLRQDALPGLGEFIVTMAHPAALFPAARDRNRRVRRDRGRANRATGAGATGTPAPRAGLGGECSGLHQPQQVS